MSQMDKLLLKIKSLDRNLRFKEIQKVLESLGYTMKGPSSGSSHKTFRKPGCFPITIPVHEPLKLIYILMVKEAIEKEEQEKQNE